jgi:post-segregation antitoxin (ccd killing protein)
MRMSRVNVYLPDDLAAEAKKSGLNISGITQDALRSALSAENMDSWLLNVSKLAPVKVDHADVLAAVKGAKDELEGI